MTREQVIQLITFINANWNIEESIDDVKLSLKIKGWEMALKDFDSDIVLSAVMNLLNKSHYPPKIADIMDELYNLNNEEVDVLDKWYILEKAISNGIYNYEEEFKKLKFEEPLIAKYLGNSYTIKEYALMDSESLSYRKHEFENWYNNQLKNQKNLALNSYYTKNQIDSKISDNLKIEFKK